MVARPYEPLHLVSSSFSSDVEKVEKTERDLAVVTQIRGQHEADYLGLEEAGRTQTLCSRS